MESLKNIVFLIVAISLVLQATVPPTALAARNEVMSSAAVSKVANDSNGLAVVFEKVGPGCKPKGSFCLFDLTSCCRPCGCLAGWCYNYDHECNEYT
ncbi:hypothetical protein ERO13_D09G206900v2 [Gossypium hirsutum]|uniref:Uncharacterized protein n=4 Tax=Gossypium TaxID=3633 RepID=A0A5J5QCE7_GOSBA|nr:hypothetical protein ES319_D09G227800v1 [Gossypium barbadense]KAG4131436.1 hypothetical protein ERO13_D09G206900v2 [Gossypium hirsutum]TYG55148.1 hypothetical protein ES288_D09G248500v1 [Gossypium darwinii]TYH55588.1 hypothetical protein ES332_D09G244600v1 [Gossypium tomentosum]TYI66608.1 hypothetical protein E1A91_D09G236100v1 [Gossypium mustelinum]